MGVSDHRGGLRDSLDIFLTVYECEEAADASLEGFFCAGRELGCCVAFYRLYCFWAGEYLLYFHCHERDPGEYGPGGMDGDGVGGGETGGDLFSEGDVRLLSVPLYRVDPGWDRGVEAASVRGATQVIPDYPFLTSVDQYLQYLLHEIRLICFRLNHYN